MEPKEYLKDVRADNYFRLADGRIIRNLDELLSILKDSGDTVFYDHVTPDRNDFVSWIRECVRYTELCNKLLPIKDRQSFLNVLGQEIDLLKNPKISETMKFFSEDYDPKKDDVRKSPSPVAQSVHPQAQLSPQSSPQQSSQPSISQAVSGNDTRAQDAGAQVSSTPAVVSGSEALDFEQAIPQIVREIQEEIFFWQ